MRAKLKGADVPAVADDLGLEMLAIEPYASDRDSQPAGQPTEGHFQAPDRTGSLPKGAGALTKVTDIRQLGLDQR